MYQGQNSPFSEFILQLQELIKADPTLSGMIKEVEEDKGQLDDPDAISTGKYGVQFPCLLVDFTNFNHEEMSDNALQKEGIVMLKLAFPQYTSAKSYFSKDKRLKGLRYFDIEWNLCKVLHGYKMDKIGYLNSKSADTERSPFGIRIRNLGFEISFQDFSSQPTRTTHQAPNNLNLTIGADNQPS